MTEQRIDLSAVAIADLYAEIERRGGASRSVRATQELLESVWTLALQQIRLRQNEDYSEEQTEAWQELAAVLERLEATAALDVHPMDADDGLDEMCEREDTGEDAMAIDEDDHDMTTPLVLTPDERVRMDKIFLRAIEQAGRQNGGDINEILRRALELVNEEEAADE